MWKNQSKNLFKRKPRIFIDNIKSLKHAIDEDPSSRNKKAEKAEQSCFYNKKSYKKKGKVWACKQKSIKILGIFYLWTWHQNWSPFFQTLLLLLLH